MLCDNTDCNVASTAADNTLYSNDFNVNSAIRNKNNALGASLVIICCNYFFLFLVRAYVCSYMYKKFFLVGVGTFRHRLKLNS